MPPGKPPFIKTPTPLRPNPWRDGEDPIPDLKPKPPPDGDSKEVTLGWADEPAAPGDYAEIIRRAANAPSTVVHTMTVQARRDWSSILSAARNDDPVHPDHDDGEPCYACIAEEE